MHTDLRYPGETRGLWRFGSVECLAAFIALWATFSAVPIWAQTKIPAGFYGHPACRSYIAVVWRGADGKSSYGFHDDQMKWWAHHAPKHVKGVCYISAAMIDERGISYCPECTPTNVSWLVFDKAYHNLTVRRMATSSNTSSQDVPVRATITNQNGVPIGTATGTATETTTTTVSRPYDSPLSSEETYISVYASGQSKPVFQRIASTTQDLGGGLSSAISMSAAAFRNNDCRALKYAAQFLASHK
jgi:hypothetical protein